MLTEMFGIISQRDIEPGLYSKGRYGIRLKNVLEVYDTDTRHPSGARFLGFRDISLVPFEPTMIDRAMLSLQEVGLPPRCFEQNGRASGGYFGD